MGLICGFLLKKSWVFKGETTSYLPPLLPRPGRASRGHDVHAGYSPGPRGTWEALSGPLVYRVVHFWFNRAARQTSRLRLGSAVWALVLRRGSVAWSSGVRRLVRVMGRRPSPPGSRVARPLLLKLAVVSLNIPQHLANTTLFDARCARRACGTGPTLGPSTSSHAVGERPC